MSCGRSSGHHVIPGAVAVLTALGILWILRLADPAVPTTVRFIGLLTAVTALLPGIYYLKQAPAGRRPIPFLPLVGLLYALYFGFPLLLGTPDAPRSDLVLDPGEDLIDPAGFALVGWMLLMAGYWAVGRVVRMPRWDLGRYGSSGTLLRSGLVFLVVGTVHDLARLTHHVPEVLAGLSTLVTLLGWVGAGFLVSLWARGRLGTLSKLFGAFAMVVLSLLQIATGSVANAARLWLVLFVAAWIGRGRRLRRLWLVAGCSAVLAVAVLRGAAGEYRAVAWWGGDLGPLQKVETYLSIVARRINEQGAVGAIRSGFETIRDRSSYVGVFGDVVRKTPASIPFWKGRTYYSLVGAFIPRFVWPSKPVKNLGQRFGHRYGYLHPTDTSTSFNFPFLIEFYVNFGALGVVLGMSIVGMAYRIVNDTINHPEQDALPSLLALGLLVPMLTVESDFSLVFGGLVLNGGALFIVLRGLTRGVAAQEHTARNSHRAEVPRQRTAV